jgi:imidazolonepropionase-like amidohydrolase
VKIAIRAAQVIVDALLPPILDGVVVVEGERIVAVGPHGDLEVPSDAVMIERPGETLMPGLVDTHAHITANMKHRTSLEAQAALDPTKAVLRGAANLLVDLQHGVTTMRTLGDRVGVEIAFRDMIAAHETPGPRLQVCHRALRPSHGTARFLATAADGETELRERIRENFHAGADWLKLFVTNVMHGETYEDYLRGDLTTVAAYSRDEIEAAIDEAHTLGMKVAAHAIGGDAMRWAIQAGVDSIEHANLMQEGDIEIFLEHGPYLSDPNLVLFFDDERGFPAHDTWHEPWWREKVIAARERTREYLPAAIAAGVKVCLAVDSNHELLAREAFHLRALGVDPPTVLACVTRHGAELLGLENDVGRLEPGMRADLIAIGADPLVDMAALEDVSLVVQEGRVVHERAPASVSR